MDDEKKPDEAVEAEGQTRDIVEPQAMPAPGPEPAPVEDAAATADEEVPIIEEEETAAKAIADLMEKLARAEQDTAALKDKALRFAAELDNTRKRARREIAEARKKGREDVLKEMLPVLDSLDLSFRHIEDNEENRSILDGIRLVQKQFSANMTRFGLVKFSALGKRFDPQRHEAMGQLPADASHPVGTVVEEMSQGYLLEDMLLRPAQVIVAAPRTDQPEESASEQAESEVKDASQEGEDGPIENIPE